MKFSFLFLILLSFTSFSQTGTLILATITTDGIAIAADSRSALFEDTGRKIQYAYFDSTQKIYPLKQFVIAIAGTANLGNTFYSKIIEDFNSTPFTDTSLHKTLQAFISYLDKKYPITLFPERIINQYITGGYVNQRPQLIAFSSNGESIQFAGTITTDSLALKYGQLAVEKGGTLEQMLQNTICDFAKGEKKEYVIGGPISIIWLDSNNESRYLQNDFSKKGFKTNTEFYTAVKNGNINITFLIPNGRYLFLQHFPHQ